MLSKIQVLIILWQLKLAKLLSMCVKKIWILNVFFLGLKGNPNFQGILNWILQILHYSSQNWKKMFPMYQNAGVQKCCILGEEKWNQIKSRKYLSAHQYQNFRKFWHNMACTLLPPSLQLVGWRGCLKFLGKSLLGSLIIPV